MGYREVTRCLEPSDEFPAFRGPVEIVDRCGHIVHIHRCHITKEHELHERGDGNEEQCALRSEELDQFLDDQLFDPFVHGQSILFLNARFAATKTTTA